MDMGTKRSQRLLDSRTEGATALDDLVPLVYDELRRLARGRLRRERPDHTLTTTGLVHEAYLKLVDVKRVQWQDRVHVLAMASKVMRRVLVDHARGHNAAKQGGGGRRVDLDEAAAVPCPWADHFLALHDALDRLELIDPRQRQILEFRYFGGLTLEETADVLGVSLTTVKRDLRFARAWLALELDGDPEV
jgi:RNA polymerase sigma factor (TIGR02999 family)